MDGTPNIFYPRKCWSSLMLFDNNKLKKLSKEYLDNPLKNFINLCGLKIKK